jgi:ABC-2 type transport system ATP-binding protein
VSAVEARDVSKRYGSVWALRDCSFQLPANRIIALVGAPALRRACAAAR